MTEEAPAPELLDGGDKLCVALLLELARFAEDRPAGTVVHVIATDPAAPLDLPAWCHMTGHNYLGPVVGQARPTYALRLSDGARRISNGRPWHIASGPLRLHTEKSTPRTPGVPDG